jgi:hypothetical protein
MLRSLKKISILFFLVSLLAFFGQNQLAKLDVDAIVLIVGNGFVYLLTAASFWLVSNGLKSKSTTSFMGSVYSSFMLKLILSAVVVVAYVRLSEGKANMPAVFICMVLYLIYTFLEVSELMKLLRKK